MASVWAVPPARYAPILACVSVSLAGIRFLTRLRVRRWRVRFLLYFLSFSFRLDSPVCAFTALALPHPIANDWSSQLVQPRAIVPVRSALPTSGTRVFSSPRVFLACACRLYPRFPGICGVECARCVICTQARWGNSKDWTYERDRAFRVVFLLNARVTCFCETQASFCSFSRSPRVSLFLFARVNEIEGDRPTRSLNSLPHVACARRLSSKKRGKTAAIVLTRSAPFRVACIPFRFSVYPFARASALVRVVACSRGVTARLPFRLSPCYATLRHSGSKTRGYTIVSVE